MTPEFFELILSVSIVLVVSCICSALGSCALLAARQSDRNAGRPRAHFGQDPQEPARGYPASHLGHPHAEYLGPYWRCCHCRCRLCREYFLRSWETYFIIAFSLAVLIFTEILPKTVGVVHARVLARFIARPIQWLVWLFTPFIWLNKFIVQLITAKAPDVPEVVPEEIEIIARMSRRSGAISHDQERVIQNILKLDELRARDIMTPRTVVHCLDRDLTLAEARQQSR